MATDQYTYGNYQNVLDPGAYAQFQQLNARWNSLFPSFSNFDYSRYLNDPGYAAEIQHNISSNPRGDIDNRASKAQAFQEMLDFFGKQSGAAGSVFPKITDEQITGYFDPLRSQTNELAGQQRQQVSGDINRASAGATQGATEALAGTGLGRSGVAANTFQGIETNKANATAGALDKVETARVQQQLAITAQEQSFKMDQDLRKQGFEVQDIQSMKNFWQQISMMNFESAAAFEPSSWLDTFGGIVDLAVGSGFVDYLGPLFSSGQTNKGGGGGQVTTRAPQGPRP